MIKLHPLLFGLLLALASGCGGSAPLPVGQTIDQPGWTIDRATVIQPIRKWTVLVYLNAANDLEAYGTLNVNQLEQVGSNNDVNVVVEFKRIKGQYDASDGNWGGTRRYFVTRDSDITHVSSPILSDNNAVDMGAPQSLQDFIQWGRQTFPAEHYCLVVWNHGAGWRSVKLPQSTRGVSYDDQYSTHIDTIQLPAALNVDGSHKWDLIALDASLMQMAEVAYEIRNTADFLVGSEESPPGTGYPYDKILRDLVASPTQSGKDLGVAFAQEMLAANDPTSDITQSVLELAKIETIAPALDNLGSALTTAQTTQATAIAAARDSSESYAYPENHDLLHFLQLLPTGSPAVRSAITQVQTAVSSALIWNGHAGAHPHSNGLAIFLPTPAEYQQIEIQQNQGFGQSYSLLALTQAAPHWQHFLTTGPP